MKSHSWSDFSCNCVILFFFIKYKYAISDTILSNALPMPNIKAIPNKLGLNTLVIYSIKHIP